MSLFRLRTYVTTPLGVLLVSSIDLHGIFGSTKPVHPSRRFERNVFRCDGMGRVVDWSGFRGLVAHYETAEEAQAGHEKLVNDLLKAAPEKN